MNLSKPQLVIVAAAGAVVLIFILIFFGILPGFRTSSSDPTKVKAALNFWGVNDSADAYADAFGAMKAVYPNVTITYRGFNNPDEYEAALLDALAANQGPDIFMIRNTDLLKNKNKIVPASPAQFSAIQLKQSFPQTVARDFLYQNNVYALPLSVDTLALIYNRNLFDQAAVPLPGGWVSWDDFLNAVPKLTKKSANGEITQAAAAIGANDLLYLLMLQSGAKMSDSQTGAVSFASNEGTQALSFYANIWNESMPNSWDAFSQRKTAMIFDYASNLPQIKSRNSFLNFEVAPMPQLKGAALAIAYPSYWGYAVSRQSVRQDLAWNFILTMTTNDAAAKGYLQKTQKPPALNSLIYQYQNDPLLGVFAKQALVAQSWFQADRKFIDRTIAGMINSVVNSNTQPKDALGQAQNQINQFLSQRPF